jgi:holin-like protein
MMIQALTWLLTYQLIGEILAHLMNLPIPGPVIGMALLLATLILRGENAPPLSTAIQQTAHTLLQHLSLLFVPAGTGVMLYLDLIADEWLPIGIALVCSTLLAMASTAIVLKSLSRTAHATGTDHA